MFTIIDGGREITNVSGLQIKHHLTPDVGNTDPDLTNIGWAHYESACPCPMLEYAVTVRGSTELVSIMHAMIEWPAEFFGERLVVKRIAPHILGVNMTLTGEWDRWRP